MERGDGKDPLSDLPLRIGKELSLLGTISSTGLTILFSLAHEPIGAGVSAVVMVGSGAANSYLSNREANKKGQ